VEKAMSELKRTLPGEHYLSPTLFDREREAIFYREWFCIGRADQVRSPGDYLHADVAGESIIVTRTDENRLAGYYNVCRHRGSQIVLDDPSAPGPDQGPSGRFGRAIRCPYHSWTYSLAGGLRSARLVGGICKEDFSLHPIGVGTWGGFLFVNLTPDTTAALPDQLGEIPDRLRRYPLEELRSVTRIVYEVDANWKVVMENYNECYHCGPVHPELCEIVPAFKEGGAGLDWDEGIPHREGAWTFTRSGVSSRRPFPGLSEEERTRHKGELCYPNLLLSLSADHVLALSLWPRGPSRTTIVGDFLFHPSEMDAPDFDPSDAIEFWDLINHQDWRICASVQRGMGSRAFEFGYFAPMEDESRDIRRYVEERLGPVDGEAE
jgi:Rieske 2Fe-2S family protein